VARTRWPFAKLVQGTGRSETAGGARSRAARPHLAEVHRSEVVNHMNVVIGQAVGRPDRTCASRRYHSYGTSPSS
jgi:hypothetical protein